MSSVALLGVCHSSLIQFTHQKDERDFHLLSWFISGGTPVAIRVNVQSNWVDKTRTTNTNDGEIEKAKESISLDWRGHISDCVDARNSRTGSREW